MAVKEMVKEANLYSLKEGSAGASKLVPKNPEKAMGNGLTEGS